MRADHARVGNGKQKTEESRQKGRQKATAEVSGKGSQTRAMLERGEQASQPGRLAPLLATRSSARLAGDLCWSSCLYSLNHGTRFLIGGIRNDPTCIICAEHAAAAAEMRYAHTVDACNGRWLPTAKAEGLFMGHGIIITVVNYSCPVFVCVRGNRKENSWR